MVQKQRTWSVSSSSPSCNTCRRITGCTVYRDDILPNRELQGKEAEKLKQDISDIFKARGLVVKIEVNKKVVK